MEFTKVPCDVRKVKKKQGKDELDRIKQAEKKRRRLEKALATSAAIRSELEQKKQRKKEEQQRLDEEGAAIAEAVALHVLLGEEDSDDSGNVMLKKDEGLDQWEYGDRYDLFVGGRQTTIPHQNISGYSIEGIGWVSDAYGNNEWMVSSESLGRDLHREYLEEGGSDASGISADLIAAQAVSSLQIGEDTPLEKYVFNQMFRW